MEIQRIEPAREFTAGEITIRHAADVALDSDEQVTFTTSAGGEYDVARKSWGFYATPSLNARLPDHGLRPVLAVNAAGRLYLLLVEAGCEDDFHAYLASESMSVVAWLDSDEAVERVVRALAPA
jgi:hypothetical protein